MADTAAFLSPLALPLGLSLGLPTPPPVTTAGMLSLLAFWGGGAGLATGGEGGVETPALASMYQPTFRPRRR